MMDAEEVLDNWSDIDTEDSEYSDVESFAESSECNEGEDRNQDVNCWIEITGLQKKKEKSCM